jgi:hypothetical protein
MDVKERKQQEDKENYTRKSIIICARNSQSDHILEDEMEGRVASIGMMRNEKNFSRKSQGK